MQHPSITHIRELIRSLRYVVTLHASEELEDDNLTIIDLESIILTGQITERQRDRQTQEVKCIIAGTTLGDDVAEAVVKIGPTGKLVIITVYRV